MPDTLAIPQLLTPAEVARACTLNPIFKAQLHWAAPYGFPRDCGSPEFALAVAAHQKECGITVDGVFGAKTKAAFRGKPYVPPVDEFIIVKGLNIKVPFPVCTWQEEGGLGFYHPQLAHCWSRRYNAANVNLFVMHYDICRSSHQCYQVLVERGLSVQFLLDSDGTVYQTMDAGTSRAWHASAHNERSVGVEICNPVKPEWNDTVSPRVQVQIPAINGVQQPPVLDFYAIQKQRARQLADSLADAFGYPRRLPRVPDWPSAWVGDDTDVPGSVARGMLRDANKFTGVCGHYHLTEEKLDPGPTLWEAFRDWQ